MPAGRRRQVEELLDRVRAWARDRPDVRAVALAGSWARDSPGADSDVDLLVLTADVARYTEREDWLAGLGARAVLRTRAWGVVTERRLELEGGLELDVGVAAPSWAATCPVDAGTARVVAGGLVALHDPDGLLAALLAATRAAGPPRPTPP